MKKIILVSLCTLACIFFAVAQQDFAPFIYGVASGDPLSDRVIL